ncbi:MAG TPA: bifunctional adenosylcobinamide kinase/adenosylcobinamide-phosphate guanylyltransferase [Dissulfurispiraceae bacterium]|nr:bifunctional adenosylcobinamide kinase/adenosylcobinamide-phosphate guanylyltransferase [Dissulfurispiraceae bacterium]
MGNCRGRIVFILGGARSGKSGFALKTATALPGRKAYIATAQALDDEMEQRITLHKAGRTDEWQAFEEPVNIQDVITRIHGIYNVLLIDCLTLWVTNLMLGNDDIEGKVRLLLEALSACRSSVFIVSNEVGLGIVPADRLTREFRDIAGALNQKVASVADEVYFMAAGLPLRIK